MKNSSASRGQSFGAVYINLGLTLALVVMGFVVTQTFTSLSTDQQLSMWTPVAGARTVRVLSILERALDQHHLYR